MNQHLTEYEKWQRMKELETIFGRFQDSPEGQAKIDASFKRSDSMRKRFADANHIKSEILRTPLEG
jgi:hypothetical protein